MKLLEARSLAIGRAERTIAAGLDLALDAGEVLCVLGPNGGGKTTLLKTLLGLLPPRAGAVYLEGAPLSAASRAQIARRIAHVPQVHEIRFSFTTEELVLTGRTARMGLFATPSQLDRAHARSALAALGMEALRTRPCDELSGGERQLVLIARALAQEARVLLMDEPTASLDVGNQARVLRVVRRLAAGGLAVVFSSHDPSHPFLCADQVALLAHGTFRAVGPTHEVLTREHLAACYGSDVRLVSVPESRSPVCVLSLAEEPAPAADRAPRPDRFAETEARGAATQHSGPETGP